MPPPEEGGRRAAFLDRDGTIIRDVHFLRTPDQIQLLEGAGPALAQLHQAGYQLVVVTNQSGVARGYFSESDVEAVHQALSRQLAELGAPLAGLYYCPHHPEAPVERYRSVCPCRKPAPGLFQQAATLLHLDPTRSVSIGDSRRDLQAARQAGVPVRLQVQTGKGEGAPQWPEATARYQDLREAVNRLLDE